VLVALVTLLALVVAACGGGSSGTSSSSSPGGKSSSGGTLTVGAEQDAACTDWVSTCASSAWGAYMMMAQTMPRVFDYQLQGDVWTEVANPMMAAMPTASEVGGKQVVTYPISEAAVWSDGQPITSEDFKYTWDQIVNGKNIYDASGYNQIESIDTTNPKSAVVTFSTPFASWTTLFSADYGIMPSHLLAGKDRDKEMKDGYSWSGGPWFFKWSKGVSVTLTPNPKWYGTKPTIQKVVFKILADTAAEFQAFRSGEVLAIYPQPEPSAVSAIKGGLGDANALYTTLTGNVEAIFLNNAKFPFDSVAVRQAIGYSIDRDAIVARLFGPLGVRTAAQTLNPGILAKYSDRQAFAGYTKDLQKVNALMTGDGWTKNGSGIWAKDGKTASIVVKSTAGNKRRELTEQILQAELKSAGFDLTIKNPSADALWGILAAGDYQMTIYANTSTSLNPAMCSIMCSANIPSKANDNSGQNWQRVNVPALDTLLTTVDTSIDQPTRIDASKKADQVMAQEQVSLPLDPLPDIVLWSKRITGPVGDDPLLSMFWNMHLWKLQG
jgi:peptide/nickel transport system substrate-binding protein